MVAKNTTDDQLRGWLELSRSALHNAKIAQNADPEIAMRQTEYLLAASRSIRQISEKVREHSRNVRASAAQARTGLHAR